MINILKPGIAIAILVLSSATSRAGIYTANFNDGTLGGLVPSTQVYGSGTTSFGYSVSGGKLNVSGAHLTADGGVFLTTPFSISGDFVATVDANWSSLPPGSDLVLGSPQFGDIYFASGGIYSIFVGSSRVSNSVANNSTFATFEITRTGNTLSAFYNTGSGFQQLNSLTDPVFAGATPLVLFLDQENGNTAFESGQFDNFTISGSLVPEPASLSLLAFAAPALLSGRRLRQM